MADLETLMQKKKKLEAQIRREKAKENQSRRKADAHNKLLIGAELCAALEIPSEYFDQHAWKKHVWRDDLRSAWKKSFDLREREAQTTQSQEQQSFDIDLNNESNYE